MLNSICTYNIDRIYKIERIIKDLLNKSWPSEKGDELRILGSLVFETSGLAIFTLQLFYLRILVYTQIKLIICNTKLQFCEIITCFSFSFKRQNLIILCLQ